MSAYFFRNLGLKASLRPSMSGSTRDLAVAMRARADADRRNGHGLGGALPHFSRQQFQDHGEAARIFQRLRILHQPLRRDIAASLHP